MIVLNKDNILDMAFEVNVDAFKNTFELVSNRIEMAMTKLMDKNAYVSDYGIEVANEVFSGGETPNSVLDIYLELKAPLVEKNEAESKKNNFLNWWRLFFSEFKNNLKIFSRNKKSKKSMEKAEKKLNQSKLYLLKHLYKDIQIQLSKVHYNTAKIQLFADKIKIVDKNDYACDINIYPVFLGINGAKEYTINKKEPQIIDFKNRTENINSLHDVTNEKSIYQIRILNSIFYEVFNRMPNQVFIESLLYNVPIEHYIDDVYETTINIFNYFINSTMQSYVSICDNKQNLFNEPMNTETLEIAIKFIKSVKFE